MSKLEVDVTLTPDHIAALFCDMDDDAQARFFVECARLATATFKTGNYWQWAEVGKHLRDCECSTLEARDMVNAIAEGMKP